jgi:plastocyanin
MRTVSPSETTTYTLTARNAGGEITGSTLVRVLPPARILSFTADKTTANVGETVTLTWRTENATNASVSDIPVSASGSRTFTLTAPGPVTYYLVAGGIRTRATAQVTVTAVQP